MQATNIRFSKMVSVLANGCPENRIDAARMLEFIRINGWMVTNNIREADLIFFNACGLTQNTEEISIKLINQINANKKSSAKLIVYGCLPKINNDRLREVYQDFTFGSDEIEQLCKIIKTKKSPQDIYANYLIPYTDNLLIGKWRYTNFKRITSPMHIIKKLTSGYVNRLSQVINVYRPHSFCIKVSSGCLNACSFCAIKFSRGRVKSKPINKIEKEFEDGMSKGYKEFALLGTDLGSYGRDQGITLTDLLRDLVKHKGNYNIRLRNLQPRFLIKMMPELIEIFQSGKISYLSSAAESGNNRILKLMKRGYTIENFKEAIHVLNMKFPEIQIRTQLMVGFPSEKEEEFQDTVRLLDEVRFDYVEIYVFQPRPNTKAAKMEEQISQEVSRRRKYKLFIKSLLNEKKRKKKALRQYKSLIRK